MGLVSGCFTSFVLLLLLTTDCNGSVLGSVPTGPGAENDTTRRVIPGAVRAASVNITGRWDDFNISWAPTPVPDAQVYYTVRLTFGNKEISKVSGPTLLSSVSKWRVVVFLSASPDIRLLLGIIRDLIS